MERIKLSKNEKKVLRLLDKHGQDALDTMPRSVVRRALRRLESLSLVRVAWVEGGDFEAVMLSKDGKDYLIENPKLSNGINWKSIIDTTLWAIGAIGGLAGFIALLRTCN